VKLRATLLPAVLLMIAALLVPRLYNDRLRLL
jgi:hypothetical protein